MRVCKRTSIRPGTLAIIAALLLGFGLAALAEAAPMAEVPPSRDADTPEGGNPSGVSGRNVPGAPVGGRLSVEAEVVGLYQRAGRIAREDLGRAIQQLADDPQRSSAQFARNRAAVLLRDLQQAMRRIDAQATRIVGPETERAWRTGLSQAGTQARELGLRDALPGAGGDVSGTLDAANTDAARTVAEDTVARLSAAAEGQAQRAAGLFVSLADATASTEASVNRAIADGLLTGKRRVAEGELRRIFAGDEGGLRSFRQLGAEQITVGNWTGPIRTYTSTVVRTRTREATNMARHQRLRDGGLDLVQIGGRVSVNFCTRFLGLVATLGAARDGFPTLASLPSGGPPFHPNCSKSTAAYDPDLVSARRRGDAQKAQQAFERDRGAGKLTEDLG